MAEILSDIGLLTLVGMAVTVLLAAILRAFTGFGFALAALPILSLALAPTTAAGVIVLLTLAVSLQTVRTYWKDVPMKDMAGMIVTSAIGTLGGTYLLLIFSPDAFRLLIGGTVMAACFLLMKYKPAPHRAGGVFGLGSGLMSGLLNGALAIPGPPVIIYSMAVYDRARVARAFLMGFFLFSAAFAATSYSIEGIIGVKELTLFAVCYPAMLIGNRTGDWLFEKYGDASHRKIAIWALFAIGLSVAAAAIL
ncbi:MAG: sulfite exporter TauE/SafE family protein [Alphaproteobacteria bacterium]|nr:sulfite exporter TauE/SafE family protein [Alphaproteobacteria bacterium]